MANLIVELDGTKKIYRYEKDGSLKYLRDERIYKKKVFVTSPDGTYLVDGYIVSAESGNREYLDLMNEGGVREYDSHCGNYRFKNVDIINVIVTTINSADIARAEAERFNNSIDKYVDFIDNGAQYEGTLAHNHRCARIASALEAIAVDLK